MLYGMTLAHDWKVNVLVDEAHNMVSRARRCTRPNWRRPPACCASSRPTP
jgi:hypothetical protein